MTEVLFEFFAWVIGYPVAMLLLHAALQFVGWIFKDFGETRWGAAIVKFFGFGPSPVSGDEYCLTFFCPRCPGKSERKRQRCNWFFYQCSTCGYRWAVYQHDYRIRRERKPRLGFTMKVDKSPE
ncbi:MAG: hypothetical protein JNK38_12795 [Acidobacteria bacterium]|nr:hypothetical protein [Acidobacteriota bacterium]